MAIAIALILVFSIFPNVLLAAQQCDAQADIVFIMDSSGSVQRPDFKHMLEFVVNISRNFEVGTSKVQFGAITFSSDAQTVFHLNTYSDQTSLEQGILATPYKSGGTSTGKALALARTSAFTAARGARDGVPKIAIVFTDGHSSDTSDLKAQAAALKASGVKVISIGIGNNSNKNELALIASLPQDVLEVTGFDVLDTINQQLTNKTCNLVKESSGCADHSSRLKSVEDKLDTLANITSRLNSVEDKLDTLANITSRLNSVEDKLDTLANITSRLKSVEDKLDSLFGLLKTQTNSDEFFDIMNTGNKEWRLAFRGTPYIKKSVFEAYKNGKGAHSNAELECRQLDGTRTCRNHYRNSDVLDNWTNIDEVALVLYLGNTQVKHMIFDGQGSTYMDWISQDRLKLSSWDDAKNETNNFFSIEGDSNLCRRFFINRNYGDCPNDAGWFVAVDVASGAQAWESSERLPVFKYSKGDSYTNWTTGDVGMASIMAVFVKYTT